MTTRRRSPFTTIEGGASGKMARAAHVPEHD